MNNLPMSYEEADRLQSTGGMGLTIPPQHHPGFQQIQLTPEQIQLMSQMMNGVGTSANFGQQFSTPTFPSQSQSMPHSSAPIDPREMLGAFQTSPQLQQLQAQMEKQQEQVLLQLGIGTEEFQKMKDKSDKVRKEVEIATAVHELQRKRLLKKEPVEVQCQFCKQTITTKIEQCKMKEEITDEEKKEAKKNWWMFLIPPIAGYLLYMANSTLTKHKCPNCDNYIGTYLRGERQYFYVPGTKEEQYAELRARMKEIHAQARMQRRRRY